MTPRLLIINPGSTSTKIAVYAGEEPLFAETIRHDAADLARSRGFDFGNVDVTLICEAPKIGPHAIAMQDRLAQIMGIEAGRVSVKATTSERLGFTGRGEGIAAIATATLMKG